jgi:putative NIF3 family GTP cyclohydrolase 1 type 2
MDDPVFEHKRRLIEKHGLVVWRCHDTIHRMRPDGILAGMEQQLGWSSTQPGLYKIAPQSVAELCAFLKARLDIPFVRVVGSLEQTCKTAAFLMGAPGGQRQMLEARRSSADVVIIGECPEWETHEYFRDAQHAQRKQALIVLGHIPSEQAGMQWLAQWLQEKFPHLSIQYVANTCPWTFV